MNTTELFIEHYTSKLYPWQAMITTFSKPNGNVSDRVKTNVEKLQYNYALVIAIVTLAFLLTDPVLLFLTMVGSGVGYWAIKTKQKIPTDKRILYGVPAFVLFVVLFLTNASSLFGAGLATGVIGCGIHAAFFELPTDFS